MYDPLTSRTAKRSPLNHGRGVGLVLSGDVEGGAVRGRGADKRQADRQVD